MFDGSGWPAGRAQAEARSRALQQNLPPEAHEAGRPAGGAAGVAMWIPVFPVDTIKSRLQSAEGNPTISGTIKQLYARGGLKAFFPGLAPAMARAVPANAATFLGVELAHQAMNKVLG